MLKRKLETFHHERFQQQLIEWYQKTMRDLPWRNTRDPYRILVSEIMLQQTRVDTVIPYYNRFLSLFPTLESLAVADEETVLKAWEGLGYYSRARNLHAAVKEVKETYGGQIPRSRVEIMKLKGIGPYTAGAVLSIAYNQSEHAVDGNVMRVLARIFLIEDDISKVKTRKLFEQIVSEIISNEHPSYFNQGLMELGALICTPTSPRCYECPVQEHCAAKKSGKQADLPVKAKKKRPATKALAAAVIIHSDGSVLIRRRKERGLLAKLWEFPTVEVSKKSEQMNGLETYLYDEYELEVEVTRKIFSVEHVFSHLIWDIDVYECFTECSKYCTAELKWVRAHEIEAFPFPVAHQKILQHYLQKEDLL